MSNLPRPVNTADFYLQAILQTLDSIESLMLAHVEAELAVREEPPAAAELEPTDRPALTPLPDKFPGRGILLEAGIEYVEDVPDAEGLAAIIGLNRATIKRILAAVAQYEEAAPPKEAA